MKQLLTALLCWLCLSTTAVAATDLVEVYFLPLDEAADIVRSQLSADGKVAVIASQQMLLLDDDQRHINRARAMLKRLDKPPGQYTAYLSIEDVQQASGAVAGANGAVHLGTLAGGWAQLRLQHQQSRSSHRQSFQLRVSSGQAGRLEAGNIRALNRSTRLWLSAYGLVQANSVELVPITSGFHITVQPAGSDQVRVHITPWMQRMGAQLRARHEVLIDLGSTAQPATRVAPGRGNMRLNAVPALQQQRVIEIAGAATELVMPLDQSVTIAAVNREAKQFADALLSARSSVGSRQFIIHLRITKSR